jgi:type IV secretion system protein VirB4
MFQTQAAEPRYWTESARESNVADFVSISAPVTINDSITRTGDYVRVWELEGVAFEAASEHTVSDRHEAICAAISNLTAGRFAIYSHRIQTRTVDRLQDPVTPKFSADFSKIYQDGLAAKPMLNKSLYFTVLYRPYPSEMAKRMARGGKTLESIRAQSAAALAVMRDAGAIIERILREFRPRLLGERREGTRAFWEAGELFSFLINGIWQRVLWPKGPAWKTLPTCRLSFGAEVLEMRNADRKRYATMLDIKEYPTDAEPATLGPLLYEDIEFIETQSFLSMPRKKAMSTLKVQRNQLLAADDAVATQIVAMEQALIDLGDGKFQMGEYHYSLAVFGDTLDQANADAAKAIGAIGEVSATELVKVDLVADAAWYAQQPGNFKWRQRRANISSRAFAGLACNHNFLRGKRDGNPWGEALMILRSPSGQGHYMNLHSSPRDEDSTDKKLPASTIIVGSTGSGKTTVLCALLALTAKFPVPPLLVSFSLDRDTEIIIRAMGGTFISFNRNVPTGLQPLQREVTDDRVAHWVALVTHCLESDGQPLLSSDRRNITDAVHTVAAMPDPNQRWFSTVQQNLSRDGVNSLYNRFARWCRGGEYGWVFDMAPDKLVDIHKHPAIGFDYTGIMKSSDVKTVVMMELLDVMRGLMTGRPIIYHVAEAWKALGDPVFAPFIREEQKTIRKKNGLGIFDTQEIGDLLQNENGRTMIEQSINKIVLPNAAAVESHYCDGLGLTKAEFDLVVSLGATGSRRFLLKQGEDSVLVEFDLGGADDMLTVLSASIDNVELLDEIRARVGDNPDDWLPILYRQVRERRANNKLLRRAA